MEELASKYNTVGIERSFQTSYGDTVTVDGGIYGYKIDVNAEFEALMEAINNGESQTREPVYSQKVCTGARMISEIPMWRLALGIRRCFSIRMGSW